jgi:hypothetical protein
MSTFTELYNTVLGKKERKKERKKKKRVKHGIKWTKLPKFLTMKASKTNDPDGTNFKTVNFSMYPMSTRRGFSVHFNMELLDHVNTIIINLQIS